MESLLARNRAPQSISGEQSRSCGCKESRPPPFHPPPAPPGQDSFLQALNAWRPLPKDRRRDAIVPSSRAVKPRPQAHPSAERYHGRPAPPGGCGAVGRWPRPGPPHPDRAAPGAPHSPRPPAAGSCSLRAGSCGRGPGPASRPPPPRATESRGGPGATAASPRGLRRSGAADDLLPPIERRPAPTGGSLTRAMVAVAILRPSRPPRARHTLLLPPRSRAIWVPAEAPGEGGKSRDKRRLRPRRGKREG